MANFLSEELQVVLAAGIGAAGGEAAVHVELGGGIEQGAGEEGTAGIAIGKEAGHAAIIANHEDHALDAGVEALEHLAQGAAKGQDVA